MALPNVMLQRDGATAAGAERPDEAAEATSDGKSARSAGRSAVAYPGKRRLRPVVRRRRGDDEGRRCQRL